MTDQVLNQGAGWNKNKGKESNPNLNQTTSRITDTPMQNAGVSQPPVAKEPITPQQNSQPKESANMNQNQKLSLHTGSFGLSSLSRNRFSEVFVKYKEALEEQLKTINEDVIPQIVELEKSETGFLYSCLVLTLRDRSNPLAAVAYHTLILEATGDKIPPTFFEAPGERAVEVHRVAGDIFDTVLDTAIQAKLSKIFGIPNMRNCDACVVPETFAVSDADAVRRLATNASLACATELSVNSGNYPALVLQKLESDGRFNINMAFHRQQLRDAVGLPIRSDVLLRFASKKSQHNQGGSHNQNQPKSLNVGQSEVIISEISAFVDLVWAPSSPQTFSGNRVAGELTQKYIARAVITSLDSVLLNTLEAVLFSLYTTLALRDNDNWFQCMKPSQNTKELDFNDIGSLNIEGNLMNSPSGFGEYVDIKSDDFKSSDLGLYIKDLVRDGLAISIDCPLAGPQSWWLNVFAIASDAGDPLVKEDYVNYILHAANTLTGGKFKEFYDPRLGVFTDTGNRIHNGYWFDRHGQQRDIRDIDHLAVINLIGNSNPREISEWSDTFLKTNYTQELRLASRKAMISNLTNQSAVFTGYSQRVTFTAGFLEALSMSVMASGVAIDITAPMSGAEFNTQRASGANFADSALLRSGHQSFNQNSRGGRSQMAGYYNTPVNRF